MKILVLADIHANWTALSAIIHETFDACLFIGDLVEYGVEPIPCIDWVRQHATAAIRGQSRSFRRPARDSSGRFGLSKAGG